MADPTPDGGGLQPLIDRLDKQDRIIAELLKPTGTQTARSTEAVNELIANQVYPDNGYASATSVSVSTSYVDLLSIPFTVPEGFTRAQVSGFGFWNAGNTDAMDGVRAYQRVVIDGVAGPESIGGLVSVLTCAFSSTAARTFAVTPGATFYVVLQGKNQVGTTGSGVLSICVANATAVVSFLR